MIKSSTMALGSIYTTRGRREHPHKHTKGVTSIVLVFLTLIGYYLFLLGNQSNPCICSFCIPITLRYFIFWFSICFILPFFSYVFAFVFLPRPPPLESSSFTIMMRSFIVLLCRSILSSLRTLKFDNHPYDSYIHSSNFIPRLISYVVNDGCCSFI